MQYIEDYIKGKQNPSSVIYPHPLYESVAKETFGILVYQEQIMQVVQNMAKFSLGESDILRRGISKKDITYINQMETEFTNRCILNGIAEKTAKEVYAMIKKFAQYGFNKSHSAAYANLAYETAYLKAHYPECFMAANCTINSDDKKKLIPCLAEAKLLGIEILPPSLQHSKPFFTIEKNEGEYFDFAIRYGLAGLDGIGEEVARTVESLNDSPTFLDFIKNYSNIRANQLTNLIYAGVFDSFGCRKKMKELSSSMLEAMKYYHKIVSIYGSSLLEDLTDDEVYEGIEYGIQEKIDNERKAVHICLSGHILEQIRPIINISTDLSQIYELEDDEEVELLIQVKEINEFITKKGQKMAFLKVEDEFHSSEAVVFPKTYEGIEHLLLPNATLIMTGKVQVREEDNGEETRTLIVNTVKKAFQKPIRIYLEIEDVTKNYKTLIKNNGLAEVIAIDTTNKECVKQDFYVDYTAIISYLRQNKIRYIS